MPSSPLKRQIDLFGATAIGVGAIIGSGIFVVIGIVAGVSGPALIFSMIIAGIIALFSAMSVAELGACMPVEGGIYSIAGKIFSPFVGFIAGWIWIFSNIVTGAVVSLGFAHYCIAVFPHLPLKGTALLFCLFFILINYHGIRTTTFLNNGLVLAKILILLFFVLFGASFFNIGNFTPMSPGGVKGILAGAALFFFAYTGFARVTLLGEEIIDPETTIPGSIYAALGISLLLYLLVGIVAIGLVPPSVLAQGGSPLTSAISITQSHLAIRIISLGAFISTASVLLMTITGVSRIFYAMAQTGDMPAVLAGLHPRYHTPHYAVLMTGAGMIVAIILTDLVVVVSVSTLGMLVYYTIINLTALKIPKKFQRFPVFVPLLGVISCVCLAIFLSRDTWFIGLAGIMSGIVWYAMRRIR